MKFEIFPKGGMLFGLQDFYTTYAKYLLKGYVLIIFIYLFIRPKYNKKMTLLYLKHLKIFIFLI